MCERGYDFSLAPRQGQGTDHFTQLIWKSTKYIGVGKTLTKRNKMTCTIIVARYEPRGNIPGDFNENVEEGRFDPSICEKLSTKEFSSSEVSKNNQKSKKDNAHDNSEQLESSFSAKVNNHEKSTSGDREEKESKFESKSKSKLTTILSFPKK